MVTASEAEAKNVQLWKGKGQPRLDEILCLLDETGIPRYYKEDVSPVPQIRLFSPAPVRPVINFEVRVLKDDLPKAQTAIQELKDDQDEAQDSNGILLRLARKTWGLSLLLAFASFFSLVFLAVRHPDWKLDNFIQGPFFRVGTHIGNLFSHDIATDYLFGVSTDILFLMIFWFTAIWWIKEFRAEREEKTTQNRA